MNIIDIKRMAKKVIPSKVYMKDMTILEIKNDEYFVVKVKGSTFLIADLEGCYQAILCKRNKSIEQIYNEEKEMLDRIKMACL